MLIEGAPVTQSILIKIAGTKTTTSGNGKDLRVTPGVPAATLLAHLEAPLRLELEKLYPGVTVTLREATTPAIELTGLKPVEEVRSVIGNLIAETLSDFVPDQED